MATKNQPRLKNKGVGRRRNRFIDNAAAAATTTAITTQYRPLSLNKHVEFAGKTPAFIDANDNTPARPTGDRKRQRNREREREREISRRRRRRNRKWIRQSLRRSFPEKESLNQEEGREYLE